MYFRVLLSLSHFVCACSILFLFDVTLNIFNCGKIKKYIYTFGECEIVETAAFTVPPVNAKIYTAIVKFFTVRLKFYFIFFGALELHFVHRICILIKATNKFIYPQRERERESQRETERILGMVYGVML